MDPQRPRGQPCALAHRLEVHAFPGRRAGEMPVPPERKGGHDADNGAGGHEDAPAPVPGRVIDDPASRHVASFGLRPCRHCRAATAPPAAGRRGSFYASIACGRWADHRVVDVYDLDCRARHRAVHRADEAEHLALQVGDRPRVVEYLDVELGVARDVVQRRLVACCSATSGPLSVKMILSVCAAKTCWPPAVLPQTMRAGRPTG